MYLYMYFILYHYHTICTCTLHNGNTSPVQSTPCLLLKYSMLCNQDIDASKGYKVFFRLYNVNIYVTLYVFYL